MTLFLRLVIASLWLAVNAMPAIAQPLSAITTPANPLLERITSQIGQQPLLRATFTQTKTMAALKRPLQSTGSLVYAKDAGVWWQCGCAARYF
jgi:hypothetical protein